MSSSTTTDCPPQARARIFATAEFSRVGRLPEEILMKIIEYVHHNSKSELTGYGHGPLEHLVKLHEFDQDPCPYVYLPPQPILNSLQALAAVNQTCYRLCRRLLWHVSVVRSKFYLIDIIRSFCFVLLIKYLGFTTFLPLLRNFVCQIFGRHP